MQELIDELDSKTKTLYKFLIELLPKYFIKPAPPKVYRGGRGR